MAQAFGLDASWTSTWGGVSGMTIWEETPGQRPPGRPRTRWRDYISQSAWERLGVPQRRWWKWLGGEELLDFPAQADVWTQISSRKQMNGKHKSVKKKKKFIEISDTIHKPVNRNISFTCDTCHETPPGS